MSTTFMRKGSKLILLMALLLCMISVTAHATIAGVTGRTTINLTAKAGTIGTGDGDQIYMWGYGLDNGIMQYPGPTVIVNQGQTITVVLTNQLTVPTSIVFPGQNVTATGGSAGLLTREAAPAGGTVTYTFAASQPGTYTYYSGTHPDLQVEMGMIGAIIVRPTGFSALAPKAYADISTAYDREFLILLTDMDVNLHKLVEQGQVALVDNTTRRAVTWFINGRTFPDTMSDAGAAWLPSQPYNCNPMMHPGDKVLMRMIGGGRDLHPYHAHGVNHLVIARDGKVLNSTMNNAGVADLPVSDYTTTVVPGETEDAIYGPWTGYKLGWDIYGTAAINPHSCTPDVNGFDTVTHEWCADHYKPIPVLIPDQTNLAFGAMYGGTPYLGVSGPLPVVDPSTGLVHAQLNPMAGISFMWHSHNEREITSNNIFIGGMATMALILPATTPIP